MASTQQPIHWGTLTQSEATAAQRTRTFLAVDITDGITPELTLDYEDAASDVQVSKNGGAFADAASVVTELSDGVYGIVIATADIDTVGEALFKMVDAAARTVLAQVQVVVADSNVASAGASELATVQTDVDSLQAATTALQSDVTTVVAQTTPTRVTGPHALGTLTGNGSSNAISLLHAIDATVSVTGTWDGATATVQVCSDVTAASPVWTTYVDAESANPLTANGSVIVHGPWSGVRVTVSGAGASTDLDVSITIRSPA